MTAKALKHKFVSAIADIADATLIRPSNWNDDHDLWLGMRTVSATSDVITNADHLTFIRYTYSAAIAVSISAPSGSNMPAGWTTKLKNTASSSLTLTGTGCTINGAASIVLTLGESLQLFSDGTTDYGGIVSLSPNSPSITGSAPSLKLLNTLIGSGGQYLTDTTSITSAYDSYEFEFVNLVPSTNSVGLYAQVMIGGSWITTGYNAMVMVGYSVGFGSTIGAGSEVSTTGFLLTSAVASAVSNAANLGVCGMARLPGPNSGADKFMNGNIAYRGTNAALITCGAFGGRLPNASPITGIRFFFSSGNINAGTVRVYGRKTS
jgi:hypothetical protein